LFDTSILGSTLSAGASRALWYLDPATDRLSVQYMAASACFCRMVALVLSVLQPHVYCFLSLSVPILAPPPQIHPTSMSCGLLLVMVTFLLEPLIVVRYRDVW
jgi:hypothetical protein